MRLTAIGIAVGALLALAMTRYTGSVLYGNDGQDPAVVAIAAALL